MTGQSLTVRPIKDADRVEWERLWDLYLDFYGTGVSQDVRDTYFARLLGDDAQDFNGFLALLDGKPVGLVHYLFHRHGWKVENCCYLQDLYVDPDVRGTGAGRALIEAVYAVADKAGAPSVYWLTQDFNHTARQLYDRIAVKTPFIRYNR